MTTLLTGGGTRGRDTLDDDVDLVRDRALVTRAQGGDRSAFDDLYMRYYRRLYRFCLRRLHDSHEAEDVAQEAFARAWRALPTFGGDRRFYPWLSVIASHLCTDVLRRRNRSTPVAEFHQGNVASTEDGGEELMIAAVDSDLVARAFTRLSDRHQRILHLREGSGWSYQRIADHEGVGITAVETLLWRARQALKREFATLAGAEGRTAAWIGSVFSLATLRRLLSSPGRGFKKLSATGAKGVAVAAGSAVAATAMVISATLSSPPVGGGASALPVSGGSSGALSLPTAGTAAPAGSSTNTTSSSSGGGASLPNLTPPPSTPSAPLGGLPGTNQLGATINNTNSTLNSVGGSLDTTLGNTTSTLGNTVNNLSGTVSTLLGGATGGSLSGAGTLITGPVSSISSLLGTVSSTESGTGTGTSTSGSTGVVSGTVNQVTGAVGSLANSLLGGG